MTPDMNPREKMKHIPVLGLWLESAYRALTRRRSVTFEIRRRSNCLPADATILQIGSNDGKTNDPLHQLIIRFKRWRVIFVEPVPYLFERLKRNYGQDSRFSFVNAAVNDGRPATFYFVDPEARRSMPGQPDFIEGLGSFDRSNITQYSGGILEPYIRNLLVSGVTLEKLLHDERITTLHLLHIDAEGHDWRILQQLNLGRMKPKIILFEEHHLSRADQASARRSLAPHYEMMAINGDCLCTLRA
jgi:FkbM family methyltransferase